MTKVCTKCVASREVSEFSTNKQAPDGKAYWCKPCVKEYNRLRYADPEIKKKINENNRAWAEAHPEYSAYYHNYYIENTQRCRTSTQKWMEENVDWVRGYKKRRKLVDPAYVLSEKLRDRFNKAIRNNSKKGSAVRDLGCSVEECKKHLESKFQSGMTWENHGHGKGKWNIDHIIPLSAYNLEDRQHVVLACHYLNLQPLWFEDNMRKNKKYNTDAGQQR